MFPLLDRQLTCPGTHASLIAHRRHGPQKFLDVQLREIGLRRVDVHRHESGRDFSAVDLTNLVESLLRQLHHLLACARLHNRSVARWSLHDEIAAPVHQSLYRLVGRLACELQCFAHDKEGTHFFVPSEIAHHAMHERQKDGL